ncbi:MAG TPA: O-antigen ligase family protein, partial [Candidatus Krumholzibacteria bacterium]|nr:O-antigen ligase family protein [Candidatus Krumholzibacteria bacterium]
RGRRMAWIGIALVVSLVGVAFVNFHVQKGRSIPELLHGGLDRDAGTRVVLWDIAWHLFKEHPVLGIGMGDFTIDANAMLAGRQVTTTVDTHNVYLQVLATRGILGFVPFVYYWVVLFMWLFRLRRRMGKGSRGYHVATGAIATAVAVLVGGLTELNIDDAEVWFAFMFVTGLAFSYMQDVMAGAGDASPDTPEPSV